MTSLWSHKHHRSVHYSNMIFSVSPAAVTPLLLRIRLILSNSIPDHPINAKGVEQLKILLSPTIFFQFSVKVKGNSTKEFIGQLQRLHTIQGVAKQTNKQKNQTLNGTGLLFNLKTLLAKVYGLIKKRTEKSRHKLELCSPGRKHYGLTNTKVEAVWA